MSSEGSSAPAQTAVLRPSWAVYRARVVTPGLVALIVGAIAATTLAAAVLGGPVALATAAVGWGGIVLLSVAGAVLGFRVRRIELGPDRITSVSFLGVRRSWPIATRAERRARQRHPRVAASTGIGLRINGAGSLTVKDAAGRRLFSMVQGPWSREDEAAVRDAVEGTAGSRR